MDEEYGPTPQPPGGSAPEPQSPSDSPPPQSYRPPSGYQQPESYRPPQGYQPPPESYRGDVLPPPPPGSPPPPQSQYPPGGGRRLGGVVLGAVIIILGLVFLGRNLGWWSGELHNWWALFILIPAVGLLGDAWRAYVANGRQFGGSAARPLVIGLLLVFVTAVFLFDLSWGYIWPIVLILVGLGLLLGRWRRHQG